MATTTDFEKLNNAIVRASMKGGDWNKLAVDWKDEVADERSWKSALPVMWSSLLNYYWTRYAELYGKTADKANLANPYDIAPGGVSKALKDLWAPTVDMAQGVSANVQAQISQAVAAAKEAVAKTAADVGEAAAKGAQQSTNQWLWALGAGAIALGGLYLFGRKTGTFAGLNEPPYLDQKGRPYADPNRTIPWTEADDETLRERDRRLAKKRAKHLSFQEHRKR